MKYTTHAFKELVRQIILHFENTCPQPNVQQKANAHKTALLNFIARTKTSAKLWMQIDEERRNMPYYFSAVKYLSRDLHQLLRDNSYQDCLDADEHEKSELEMAQLDPALPALSDSDLQGQLQKAESKNLHYENAIQKMIAEKSRLQSGLDDEIEKNKAYQGKMQELTTQISLLTPENGEPSSALMHELKMQNAALLKENARLSSENKELMDHYEALLAQNKKLKLRCDELESSYTKLSRQLTEQSQLFNQKLSQAQADTQQLRDEFESRLTAMETRQPKPSYYFKLPEKSEKKTKPAGQFFQRLGL